MFATTIQTIFLAMGLRTSSRGNELFISSEGLDLNKASQFIFCIMKHKRLNLMYSKT